MEATWRFLSFLTNLVNRLIVLGLAGMAVVDLVRDDSHLLESAVGVVLREPVFALIGVSVLVILNLNVVQFSIDSLRRTPARAFITSHTPGGRSRVAISAIQRALRATAAHVPEIARAKLSVRRIGRSRFRVHVRYLVRDVRNAGTAAEHLRLVLKKRFAELVILDPKDRVDFDLDLAGIVKVDGASEPKRLPAPPDVVTRDSFHGPVYPVEGELS